MRSAHSIGQTFVRTIRRRAQPPADFIVDATTFADTHSVINDPYSPLPYPEKQLFSYLSKEAQLQNPKLAKKAYVNKMEKLKTALNFDHIPIDKQIFVLVPGQGEQHVGMGKTLQDHRASMELFERASTILNYNVWETCQNGPQSKLDQTLYSHVALFVNAMAGIEKLRSDVEDFDERVTEAAGFGVGEFCALVLGGVLKFEDALKIVDAQARFINECNQLIGCSTFAIKVYAASQLDLAITEARNAAIERGEMPLCEIAGYLYCGMKIMGASNSCKKMLTENSERYQFKVVGTLPTIGAPYTGLMRPAEQTFIPMLKDVEIGQAHINVYSNFTGKVYPRKKSEIRQCIFRQFSNPIKWEQIMQVLYRKHQDYTFPLFYELGTSKQLSQTLYQTSKRAHERYVNYPC